MLDVGGQDATEAFEDVGHSDEAREILEGLLYGTLKRMVRHQDSLEELLRTSATSNGDLADVLLKARRPRA